MASAKDKTLALRRAKRKRREGRKNYPSPQQALKEALLNGHITAEELKAFHKKPVKKTKVRPKKAVIIYGLNTNSM